MRRGQYSGAPPAAGQPRPPSASCPPPAAIRRRCRPPLAADRPLPSSGGSECLIGRRRSPLRRHLGVRERAAALGKGARSRRPPPPVETAGNKLPGQKIED